MALITWCESDSNFDPSAASNFDPCFLSIHRKIRLLKIITGHPWPPLKVQITMPIHSQDRLYTLDALVRHGDVIFSVQGGI